jgi:putative flippase GtrA
VVKKHLLKRDQILKFVATGLLGLVIDNVSILAYQKFLGSVLLSKLLSTETAVVVMFFINNHWTYARDDFSLLRLLKSNLTRVGGLLISLFVIWRLNELMPLLVANTVSAVCGFAFNYFFETLYTWRVQQKD